MGAKTAAASILGGGASGLEALQIENIGAGEKAQVGQIQDEQLQQRMAAEEQSIQRNKQLEKVLGAANAQSAARGISAASGSFKAVQEQSIQTGITADRVSDLNLELKENRLRTQIDSVHKKAQADRFNSLLDFGENIFEDL